MKKETLQGKVDYSEQEAELVEEISEAFYACTNHKNVPIDGLMLIVQILRR